MRLLYVSNIPSLCQLELFGHVAQAGLADMWFLPRRSWKRPDLPKDFEVVPQLHSHREVMIDV